MNQGGGPWDEAMRTAPTAFLYDSETGRRGRANHGELKKYPDKVRTANVVCLRTKPPALVAVVLGGRGPGPKTVISTEGMVEKLGDDFLASCRCGLDHVIVGHLLRAAVEDDIAEQPRRKGVPRIEVASVERRAGPDVP